jgi:YHS domain-containing protein
MNQNLVQLGRKKTAESDFQTFADPVCKMIVTADTAAGKYDFRGETFYFCAVSCLNKFRQNPEKFLDSQAKPEPMIVSDEEYTCPMHPEIVRIGHGTCPICGNAAEFSRNFVAENICLDSIYTFRAGRALGRISVFRPRRAIGEKSFAEYVHADCNRHGRGVFV